MGRLINYKDFYRKVAKLLNISTQRDCLNSLCVLAIPIAMGTSRLCVKLFLCLCVFVSSCFSMKAQRKDISLNNDWLTSLTTTNTWKKVNVPHNWDDYYGYRRLVHGNLHADADYKKSFTIRYPKEENRFFLFFEGVGSYATVYVNDKLVGSHAGGRTTFTLDITDKVKTDGSPNNLLVKVSHPSNIKDLPWACGGCSDERGFSEGSQPLGIFRPVHLIVTNEVRIEPFGVHAWADIKDGLIDLFVNTTIKNYSSANKRIDITHLLVDPIGNHITEIYIDSGLQSSHSIMLPGKIRLGWPIEFMKLWSPDKPALYKIITTLTVRNRVVDKVETPFGFRTISWKNSTNQFFLNSKPVFLNGVGEYEHLLGQSHAFSREQITSRMKWVKYAGFNAFRDAHQPHNLLYGQLCDSMGILWWTQFSAHIWYDSPEFRNNFKQLLKEWVIERRNDPSVILWGLQNESKLPEDFAKECSDLIRSLDPTASSQRLITTCNGGSGTDWDVPQNWTGTYGGDPKTYASDIKKQVLIGEYGAWRTLDLHTEGGFVQNGVLSEDRMTQLMEQKIRLAESVKDSCAGQFFWILSSHDNPGRVQGGEGVRELDRVGPVNYKGLLTPWEEPTDAFYMFRSNYASKEKDPMVYIVSHTWPNRWMKPGIKDGIIVYSNCDEVELFNDIDNISLGKRKKNGVGTHFQWDKVNIQYNVLYAVGYVGGKTVARDTIALFHLPQSPNYNKLYSNAKNLTKPEDGYNYVYRINCGGPDYIDENKNKWFSDDKYSTSWAKDFEGMPAYFASQRRTFAPIKNANDWRLFQTFRYGKDKLKYELKLADGEYLVDLYFIEPWLNNGMNAKAMRLFDVAVNGKIVLDDLDIWNEAGFNTVLKKTVKVKATGGKIVISFPETKSGQALISAIAVAKKENNFKTKNAELNVFQTWLDIGDKQYSDADIRFNSLPSYLFGAARLQFKTTRPATPTSLKVEKPVYLYLLVKEGSAPVDGFENMNDEIITDEKGGTKYIVYRKLLPPDSAINIYNVDKTIIAWHAVSKMQPAYDLKPVVQYKSNVVKPTKGIDKELVNGRECATVKTGAAVAIDWPIQTGVADIYSITVKYFYPGEKELKGKIQLIGSGNTMMHEEPISFTFTRTGKWNQFTINTGNMINAGNYTVKLIVENGEGLAVSGIDVQ